MLGPVAAMAKCPGCPSPGLLPPQEINTHVLARHKHQAFRCAVCKHSGVNLALLLYSDMRDHMREEHGVTEETEIAAAVLLPSPEHLLEWMCKLCNKTRLTEAEVVEHVKTKHGEYFLTQRDKWLAVCRICNIVGTKLEMTSHLEDCHRPQALEDSEEEEEEVPVSSRGPSQSSGVTERSVKEETPALSEARRRRRVDHQNLEQAMQILRTAFRSDKKKRRSPSTDSSNSSDSSDSSEPSAKKRRKKKKYNSSSLSSTSSTSSRSKSGTRKKKRKRKKSPDSLKSLAHLPPPTLSSVRRSHTSGSDWSPSRRTISSPSQSPSPPPRSRMHKRSPEQLNSVLDSKPSSLVKPEPSLSPRNNKPSAAFKAVRNSSPIDVLSAKYQEVVGSSLTSPCPYCGLAVTRLSQPDHTRQEHLELTFRCRVCPEAARYLYSSLSDLNTHLRLRHSGPSLDLALLPGSRSNLGALAWVDCKFCTYQGVGLGRETLAHSDTHGDRTLLNYVIFCRLCHSHKIDQATIRDIFDNSQEFEEHMKETHPDILRHLRPGN